MSRFEIIQSAYYANRTGESPFIVAIVDDAENDDAKLIIMFEDDGYTAVLSLDSLVDEEDISTQTNTWNTAKYEKELRDLLWNDEEIDFEI